jgi:hypothetical protein
MTGNEGQERQQARAWFEVIGAPGLASLGAVLGLFLSVTIVLATAPPLPARPAELKKTPVILAEKPGGVEERTVLTSTQGLISAPQPLVSMPKAEATVAPAPRPQPVTVNASTSPMSTSAPEQVATQTAPTWPSYTEPSISASSSSGTGGGGGTVHVRGYYRKNGTYVQPHTRRAPRR